MKREKQQLIHDLLEGDSRQESTLLAAAKILRRRRRGRLAWRTIAVLILCAATTLLVEQNRRRPILAQVSPPKSEPPATLKLQSLTDDQLLSLFPNTPVGLATLPNGKKLLLFPRSADEALYVTRL